MDHQPSAILPAALPIVGQLYTTDEVAKLLRVSQRAVQDGIGAGTLTAVRYGQLCGSPGGSGDLWRGPKPAHPVRSRRGREPHARAGWRGAA